MTDPKIRISSDEASIKAVKDKFKGVGSALGEGAKDAGKKLKEEFPKAAEAAGKEAGKKLSDALREAIKSTMASLDSVFGKQFQETIGGKKLGASFEKGFKDLAKDSKWKQSTKKLGENLSATLSETLGAKISAKDIQATIQKITREAERALGGGSAGTKPGKAPARQGALNPQLTRATLGQLPQLQGMMRGQGPSLGGLALSAPSALMGAGLIGGGLMLAGGAVLGTGAMAISSGRSEEEIAMETGARMGRLTNKGFRSPNKGSIRAGIRRDSAGLGYTLEEAANLSKSVSSGGGSGARRAVLEAQRGFGGGADVTSMILAQTQRGNQSYNNQNNQKAALDILRRGVSAGLQSGLETGRLGEIFRGIAHMTTQRGFGMSADSQGILRGLMMLSGGKGTGPLRGTAGFEAMGALERLGMGGSTGMGRAIGLQVAGLGKGKDIFSAQRQMELGFFGEQKHGVTGETIRTGGGVEGINKTLSAYRKMYGFGENENVGGEFDAGSKKETMRGALLQNLANDMGITATQTETLVQAIEGENKDKKTLDDMIKAGMPLEQKAYEHIMNMADFNQIKTAVDNLKNDLWSLLQGPLTETAKGVTALVTFTDKITKWMDSSLTELDKPFEQRAREAGVDPTSPQNIAAAELVAEASGVNALKTISAATSSSEAALGAAKEVGASVLTTAMKDLSERFDKFTTIFSPINLILMAEQGIDIKAKQAASAHTRSQAQGGGALTGAASR